MAYGQPTARHRYAVSGRRPPASATDLSRRDQLPLCRSTHPRTGEDLRRLLARTPVHLRPASITTRLGLNFPGLTVSTDVHIATSAQAALAVPPVPLDPHLPTV